MYHIKHTAAEVIGNPIANVQGIVCHFKYSATMEIKNAMFVANVKNKKRARSNVCVFYKMRRTFTQNNVNKCGFTVNRLTNVDNFYIMIPCKKRWT